MINNNLDTLVTYTLDPVCVIGEICKIHKHRHVKENNNAINHGKFTEFNPDYTNPVFDVNYKYYISDAGQMLYVEKKVNELKSNVELPGNIIRFSDTLKLNELKYLKQGDTRSAGEFIVMHPKKEKITPQNNLNGVVLGFELTIMLACTSVYLVRSFNDWFEMICKIKFALKP